MPKGTKPISGVVIPHRLPWHGKLAAFAIYNLTRAVTATLRCHWDDQSALLANDIHQPVIFCTWHNRLALSMVCYHGYVRQHDRHARLAAMISASKDGGLLAATIEHFQVQPVRGSTSRRGRQALLELTSWIEQGYHVAITPDGPRGPRYRVQEGVIALAQLTGVPIIPSSNHVQWKITMRSWDQFQIPLPFSRCRISFGPPVLVPRDASEEDRKKLSLELEARMTAITKD